ncbi:DUF1566 domain-containing protein [Sorangium sp. So ce1000]|uniref:Lcl C-terminal domain-containing protein n=1 Tax=Sorangium sp. So ce1000 TaxID=3133325 RepID=UPI003F5FB2CC
MNRSKRWVVDATRVMSVPAALARTGVALGVVLAAAACGQEGGDRGAIAGSGGWGTGGALATGGALETGAGVGGAESTAGGGAPGDGGAAGEGGDAESTAGGGAPGDGGAAGEGGDAESTASGGAPGDGGAAGEGGGPGSGGAGGAPEPCSRAAACGTHKWACWPMPNPAGSGLPNPASYTDVGGGVVRDNVTCLEWQETPPSEAYTWEQAISYCDELTLGGFSDWRLPTPSR